MEGLLILAATGATAGRGGEFGLQILAGDGRVGWEGWLTLVATVSGGREGGRPWRRQGNCRGEDC
jgi:hypothetical protein